ncbi:D-2-hydroxyacid dehydrogenase [Paenibacillus oryzisoli]|uniref:Glycerate dehydrogenase n=1 Tax=Paenibacillus oryzisoli TaxID=1850517 RepID=A0A198AH94_9BACL|nr:D-2-hydroxyacid dehydrogenase [Paenibacillus oryzisoli]OAS20445.1 glycerate dehydrogenase [Paenibacillus oryzisoli]
MKRIIVLDGYTLNPGDLSWAELHQLGNVTVYDRTAPEDIVERIADADIVLTNKTPISADTIRKLDKLTYIGVLATGYNIVDTEAARERGIHVTNVPTYGTPSVAQYVFALLLELCHRVQVHSDAVHAGDWVSSPDFCFVRHPLMELAGKTLGLIGVGRIGQQTARIAMAFGMNVIAVGSGTKQPDPLDGVQWVDMSTLFTEADVISLHCPLTPQTDQLIRREWLQDMKRTALLINTSRGGLVQEADLADALNEGIIAGAALDVLSVEPPKADNPLLQARNCLITPHIAWATKEARARLIEQAVENVRSFLNGNVRNDVHRMPQP